MAPSLRDIRKAATKRRKIEKGEATLKEEAITKVPRKIEGGETSIRREYSESRPRSPPPVLVDLTEVSPEQGGIPSPPLPTVPDELPVTAPELAPRTVSAAEGEKEVEPTLPEVSCSRPEVRPTPTTVDSVPRSGAEPASSAPEPIEENVADASFQTILSCHTRWAEETLTDVSVPGVQRFLHQQNTATFFREASVAHLWAANSLIAVKGLWTQAQTALDHAFEEIQDVKARAETALKKVQSEATRAQRAEAEAEAARLRVEKAEDTAEVARRQAAHELENAQMAEDKQKEAEEKLATAESEVLLLTNRLHSALIDISAAEERADNAEEIARRCDAELANMRAAATEAAERARKAEEKVLEVEKRASEAEKRATEAVDIFRKSAAFDKELAETTAFAYNGGFQDCKEKIRKLYGLEGIEDLQPDEEDATSDPDEP